MRIQVVPTCDGLMLRKGHVHHYSVEDTRSKT